MTGAIRLKEFNLLNEPLNVSIVALTPVRLFKMPLNLFLQLLNNSSLKRFKSFLNPISPDKTIRENFTDHQLWIPFQK
jgi:hypothetical protein